MPENEGQVSLSCLLMNCIALGQKTKSSAHTQSVEYGDLSNGGKLDPVVIPEKSFSERAAWLFDDAMKMYDFLSRYNNNLKKANIEYDPWHTTQSDVSSPELTVSHFNIFENVVKIIDTDTLSPNVTLHELGHLYMYEDYANRLPKSDCFSGRHIMYGTTEPGCAWNEGWAHFLSLVVNNSSIFDYGPSLGSVTYDIEDTTLFEGNGDAVEGRVAGALWDLYDKADDGLDTRDYAFSDIYSVIKTSVSEGNMIKNFADFWDKWKSLKFDKSAKYSIHQNQIVYLSPGEPELIEGQENQMIKITDISNATYNIVTSRYRDNRPLEINIYADFELKKLIKGATGVYSNPFPSLKDLELKEGQVYYLVVSDAIYLNSAVSAEVHLSLSRSPRAYPTLSPEVPAAINNQKEQVYVIEGDDQTGSIETSCYTTPNRQTTCFDTVLELYSDASLETLVASDDNAEPGNQARISGFTFKKGQTYYVRVRNSQVVQSISATVTFTTNTNYPTLKGNVPELFANKVKMVYKLEGYDGIPIIETSDYTSTDVQSKNSPIHSDTFLELYSDPYLKTRIAFDDNSAGNKLSRISSVKFEPGKTYYLKVRHPYPSVPITTAIMYRPIMTLAHKKVQILNGETERICRIQGANSRVSIKTGPFGHLSDTYLELYSDANLTRRIASDDNSLGGGYAGIDWRLDEGNTVYLKVKSGKDKNRTGPAVTPVYAWIYMEYLPHG